jgi:hypothetical protein
MGKLFLVIGLLTGLVMGASAQSFEPKLNPDNLHEWGEAVEKPATAAGLPQAAPVMLQVQVRFHKRIAMGCQYQYQVTNTSNYPLALKMFAVAGQKYNEKIPAGRAMVFLASTTTRCGDKAAKDDEPCLNCQPPFQVTAVSLAK